MDRQPHGRGGTQCGGTEPEHERVYGDQHGACMRRRAQYLHMLTLRDQVATKGDDGNYYPALRLYTLSMERYPSLHACTPTRAAHAHAAATLTPSHIFISHHASHWRHGVRAPVAVLLGFVD